MSIDEPSPGITLTAHRDLFVTGGTITQANIYQATGPRDRLLQHASANAIHDSDELVRQGICFGHTRVAVLKLLHEHLSSTGTKSPDFLWLNGPAGVGKSAIARTIAQSASEEETLLGSFFFYNSDATRNTISPLIPTLAVQICRRFRQARAYVEEAIEDDPLIFTKSITTQAHALIVRPLQRALRKTPPLDSTPFAMLVDGLDECTDADRQVEIIDALLGILDKIHASTSLRIKLVIFSRPERWIRTRVSRWEKAGKAVSVALNENLTARGDMVIYYNTHFAAIREEHPMSPSLGLDWPSPEQMDALVDRTDNNFAFATTMRIFVANPTENPRAQLKIVLGIAPPTRASPHTPIDKLYAAVFSRVPAHLLPKTLRIIGSFLVPSPCALSPSPLLLELVFSLEKGEIQQMFFHLESLFDLGNRVSSWIHVHHKSVADFLFDPERSKEYGLFIDQAAVYEDMRSSVCSVFFRALPGHEELTMLVQYLRRLKKQSDDAFPSQWTNSSLGRTGPPPTWAVAIANDYHTAPILRFPSFSHYVEHTYTNNRLRELAESLSTYDSSALGRIGLVLSGLAFFQLYNERNATFYHAFVRHAIRSQPGLQELDETLGFNLITCDPNNLAEATIYLLSQPRSYILNLRTQALRDALDPDWVISRLGMLLSWHESGHRSTDDPWEHAARGEVVETPSESQLQCPMCAEVLELCKAEIICDCLLWLQPESGFYQDVFDHVQTRPSLWNHFHLFYRWTQVINEEHSALVASDAHLSTIANAVRKQDAVIVQDCKEKQNSLVLDGWDDRDAFYRAHYPYSRACIPFGLSHKHALRVSNRWTAWDNDTELPEVVYTYPTEP